MEPIQNKNILSKESFSKKIENYVVEFSSSYMDATIAVCNQYGIEYNVASKLLNRPILEHLREEGNNLNIIPRTLNKTKKLPF